MSDHLYKIIKSILLEYDRNKIQRPNDYDESGGIGAARRASQLPATGSFQADKKASEILQPNPYEKKLAKILFDARNKIWGSGWIKSNFNNMSDTVPFVASLISIKSKNPSINPKLLKGTVTLIFRESKGTPAHALAPKEVFGYIDNLLDITGKLNYLGVTYIPGVGEIKPGHRNHSQGYGQIQPSLAKKFGLDMNSLYTVKGSMDGVLKLLSSYYSLAKKYYSGSQLTYFENGKLVKKPALDNDAALHIALAAHNAGTGIITKWCETDVPGIANPCSTDKRSYEGKKTAITKKDKVIPNYYPKKGTLHNYMESAELCYKLLSSLPKTLDQAVSFQPNVVKSLSSVSLSQDNLNKLTQYNDPMNTLKLKSAWDRNSAGDEGYWSVLKKRLKETGFKIIQDPKDKYFQHGPWKIYKNPSDGYQIYGSQVPYRPVSGKIVSYKGKYAGEVLDKTIIQTKTGKKYTLKNLLNKNISDVI